MHQTKRVRVALYQVLSFFSSALPPEISGRRRFFRLVKMAISDPASRDAPWLAAIVANSKNKENQMHLRKRVRVALNPVLSFFLLSALALEISTKKRKSFPSAT